MYKLVFFFALYFLPGLAEEFASREEIEEVARICSPQKARLAWGEAFEFARYPADVYRNFEKDRLRLLEQKDQKSSQEENLDNKTQYLIKKRQSIFASRKEKKKARREDLLSISKLLDENNIRYNTAELSGLKTYKDGIDYLTKKKREFLREYLEASSRDYLGRSGSEYLAKDGWKKFSKPLLHDPLDYRYMVHGISENSKGEVYFERVDFFREEASLVLSVSVVDKKMSRLTTARSSGVILEVPRTNIFASCSYNMSRCGAGSKAMNKKFGLADLDEVLLSSNPNSHNELTIESHVKTPEFDSAIGISGYFISMEYQYDITKGRLDKISQACQKNQLPLILLEKDN